MLARPRHAVAAALAGACALGVLWSAMRPAPRLMAQSERAETVPRDAAPLASPIPITVDAASTAEVAPGGPDTICGLPARDGAPPWRGWAPLEGTRVVAFCNAPILSVYAVRVPQGAALLIANHAEARTPFRVQVRLPRGVYTADRLVFDMQNAETPTHIERLESVVLAGDARLTKPGQLEPGHAAVYRFLNRGARAEAAFRAVKEQIRPFAGSCPREFQKLMAPLHECEDHVAALSSGITPDLRYAALPNIHRALLTVSHAQTLCQNFRNEGRLGGEGAGALEDALNQLENELVALSAGCLNLVPDMAVTAPDLARPAVRQVTIALTNAGGRSVSFVRIGADAPTGSTVQPAEQAMFGAVRPGETVRATFTVQLGETAKARSITADIAYYAAGAPAHLRLKPI